MVKTVKIRVYCLNPGLLRVYCLKSGYKTGFITGFVKTSVVLLIGPRVEIKIRHFRHFSWPRFYQKVVIFIDFPCFLTLFPNGSVRVGVFGVFYVNYCSKPSFSVTPWAKHTQKVSFLAKRENPVFNKTRKTRKFPVLVSEESYLIYEVQQINGFCLICLKLTVLSLFGPRVCQKWQFLDPFMTPRLGTLFEDYCSIETSLVDHLLHFCQNGSEIAHHFQNKTLRSQRWRRERFLSVRCHKNVNFGVFHDFSWNPGKFIKRLLYCGVLTKD